MRNFFSDSTTASSSHWNLVNLSSLSGISSFGLRLRRVIALGFCMIALVASQALASVLTEGRTFVVEDGTQVIFNLDQNVTPEVQILHNPQRLVIDIPRGRLGRLNRGLENSPDIRQLRIAEHPDKLRVVFDLSGPYHGRASILRDNTYRLVVDIFRSVANTPTKHPIAQDLAAAGISAPPPSPRTGPAATPDVDIESVWSKASQSNTDLNQPDISEAPANEKPAPSKLAEPPKQNPTIPVTPYRRHKVRVIIDAGHGAHDPGAIGPNGTQEKDVVLSIAKKLAAKVEANDSMTAILTRDSDKFLKLYDRVSFARRQKGDVFVSLHANAVPKSSAKTQAGSMVFILNRRGATSKLAKYLAESENQSGSLGGQDIIQVDSAMRDLVYGMVQGAVIDESRILASHILKQMKSINNVFKYAVEGANFAVLSAPDIPSVLVETTFISTPSEERKLKQADFQNRVADAIYQGLVGFTQQRQHIAREISN